MRQKFRQLTFVKVADKMPSYMRHFKAGFTGIVRGTYSQIHDGSDVRQYSLYVVEDAVIVNRISWYEEGQLTALLLQDPDLAEEMIETYNLRNEVTADTD
jgi:hypothetical protein